MKDLHLKIYIKNNLILKKAEEIYGQISLRRLAEYSSICAPTLYYLVNFTISPVTTRTRHNSLEPVFDGLCWTAAATKLANALKCTPWDIFPEHFWKPRHRHKYELEVESTEVLSLFENEVQLLSDESQNPLNKLIKREKVIDGIKASLAKLTPREEKVLRLRFGLDGEGEHTLRQIADIFHIGAERVRQIEAKAFRKLRHPMPLMSCNLNLKV